MAAGEFDDDGPVFDEAFIAGAPYAEATAEERVRRAGRIARDHKQAAGWRGPVAPGPGRGSTRAPKRRDSGSNRCVRRAQPGDRPRDHRRRDDW